MKRILFVGLVLLGVTCFSGTVSGDTPDTWVEGGTVTSGYCERTRNGAQETHPGVDIAKYEGEGANKKSVEASSEERGWESEYSMNE